MEGTALVRKHHKLRHHKVNTYGMVYSVSDHTVSIHVSVYILNSQTSMSVQLGLTTVNSCAPIHKAHSHVPVALDSYSTAMDAHAELVS